jgi:Mor family transcriptional regulator
MVKMISTPPDHQQTTLDLQKVEHTDDVVEYTIRCVLAMAPALSAAMHRHIEEAAGAQVKLVFGGERHYITSRDNSRRDAQIRSDYQAGERIPLLERRYRLKKSRLLEIINK